MSDTGTIQDSGPDLRFEHRGAAGELAPIAIVNALLNIVTLTFYRFWAKTRVRRYLWGRTTLLDDPLEYTGTGKELFLGFLIVLVAVLLPLIAANTMIELFLTPEEPLTVALNIAIFLVVMFLIGVAIYRARRYRLSRTAWRGIRGAQTGSAVRYALKNLGFILLLPWTLGWIYPVQRMRLMDQMMNNTWFGDRRFSFVGGAGPLYRRFGITWFCVLAMLVILSVLPGISFAAGDDDFGMGTFSIWHWMIIGLVFLIPVALPLIMVWYRAGEFRYMASCASYEGLRFTFDATTGSLIRLTVGNLLIMILTLGFGLPFVQMRKFRYFCDRLRAEGEVDFDAIRQSSEQRPEFGEGLADAFDVGAV